MDIPARRIANFWTKVHKTEKCWLWTASKDKKGYGKFTTGIEGRWIRASRFAWIITYGPIPSGLCVCHHCDNPSCVRPDHLFLGTKGDNNRDRAAKGRNGYYGSPGERNGRAKVGKEKVIEIRNRLIAGESPSLLSIEFSLGTSQLWRIKKGKAWSHI